MIDGPRVEPEFPTDGNRFVHFGKRKGEKKNRKEREREIIRIKGGKRMKLPINHH